MKTRTASLLLLMAVAVLVLAPASAAQAAWSNLEFFGNAGSASDPTGGNFATGTGAGASPGGVAINDPSVADGNGADGDVYVADKGNNRIQQFRSDGTFIRAWGVDVVTSGAPNDANEMQAVMVNAGSGNFELSFNAVSTGPIAWNASASAVQTALNGLSTINSGGGSVTVSGGPGDVGGATPYLVNFNGVPLAGTNVAALVGSNGTLAGGTGGAASKQNEVFINTLVEGAGVAGFEICDTTAPLPNAAADCKAGLASELGGGMNSPSAIDVNQATGDVYVTDRQNSRIVQFDARGNFIRAWGRDTVSSGPGNSPAANAVQELNASAGGAGNKYKLSFQGQTTGEIETGTGQALLIQTELRALPLIGEGSAAANVIVTEPSVGSGVYRVEFSAKLASNPEPLISASAGAPPASPLPSTATTTPGSNEFEICTAAAVCKTALKTPTSNVPGTAGAMSFSANSTSSTSGIAVAPLGAPNAGSVVVADPGNRRISEYSASGRFIRAFGWDVVNGGPGNDPAAPVKFEVCQSASFDTCKAASTTTPAYSGEVGRFAGAGGVLVNTPNRVAVDSKGTIYTVESTAGFRVQKFTLPANVVTPLGTYDAADLSGSTAANAPVDLAIDPSTNHLFVAKIFPAATGAPPAATEERRVLEIDPTLNSGNGGIAAAHIVNQSPAINSLNGLAVRRGGDSAYVTSTTPKPGVYILGALTPPNPIVEATTSIEARAAVLHGRVELNGGPVRTSYQFEYKRASDANVPASWTKAPAVAVDLGNGEGAGSPTSCPAGDPPVCSVSQAISGLEPHQDYNVRLVAIKGNSTTSTGTAGDFMTLAAPPDHVKTFSAVWDTSTEELVLRGSVNPNNSATTYYFEYGQAPCSSSSCASIPVAQDGSAGSGGKVVIRTQRLAGLEPGSTYHFRIVADNGTEVSLGVTEVRGGELTAEVPAATKTCPNEGLRAGFSKELPECRAYERVSEGDSNGIGVLRFQPVIADDGNRAQFTAQAFGSPHSLPNYFMPYISTRTPGGWTVHDPSPAPEISAYSSTVSDPDLNSIMLMGGTRLENQRAEVNWSTFHLGDGSLTSPAAPFVPLDRSGDINGYVLAPHPMGASADLSKVVFLQENLNPNSAIKYFADEPLVKGLARSSLYEISGAQAANPVLSLVNRAEGKAGAVIGGVCGAGLGASMGVNGNLKGSLANAVSRDGSVVYFSARPDAPAEGSCPDGAAEVTVGPKRLFKRIDGEHTVEISASKCSPACGGPNGDDAYRDASTDGSVVYFTTPRRLLNADADSSPDLYVYDANPPVGEPELALVSGAGGADVTGFLATAADGSHAYFTAKGVLTGPNAEGDAPVAGQQNLYAYERDDAHPSGRVTFVGMMNASDVALDPAGVDRVNRTSYALPRLGGAGDGHLLLFVSTAAILPEDIDSSSDLYRYDQESEQLQCLSCIGTGEFDVTIPSYELLGLPGRESGARPASADGSTVIFATKEGLVDEDLNGANDVYLWRDGSLGLLSAGSGENGITALPESASIGISPDGRDVFFLTAAPLIGADDNNARDIYDARVGGGFTEPATPARCASADGCQGVQSQPSAGTETAGSDSFSGPGNRVKGCRKGTIRKHGRCVKKVKANKKHHKRRAQRAGSARGGNR